MREQTDKLDKMDDRELGEMGGGGVVAREYLPLPPLAYPKHKHRNTNFCLRYGLRSMLHD